MAEELVTVEELLQILFDTKETVVRNDDPRKRLVGFDVGTRQLRVSLIELRGSMLNVKAIPGVLASAKPDTFEAFKAAVTIVRDATE